MLRSGTALRRAARLAAVLAGLGAPAALAQNPTGGDPVAGLALARNSCAACHVIDGTVPPQPRSDAPAFGLVAAMPSLSGMGLRVFLRTPHGDMPRILFSDRELDDIVAYIRTLAPK